jgi:hypothetical protein
MFNEGKFGSNEGWGVVFIDNMLIYVGNVSVEGTGKLAATWGETKNR